jgi:hypothetical protein
MFSTTILLIPATTTFIENFRGGILLMGEISKFKILRGQIFTIVKIVKVVFSKVCPKY